MSESQTIRLMCLCPCVFILHHHLDVSVECGGLEITNFRFRPDMKMSSAISTDRAFSHRQSDLSRDLRTLVTTEQPSHGKSPASIKMQNAEVRAVQRKERFLITF